MSNTRYTLRAGKQRRDIGVGLFVAWFVFVLLLNLSLIGGVVFVVYKVLAHFGIL